MTRTEQNEHIFSKLSSQSGWRFCCTENKQIALTCLQNKRDALNSGKSELGRKQAESGCSYLRAAYLLNQTSFAKEDALNMRRDILIESVDKIREGGAKQFKIDESLGQSEMFIIICILSVRML